MASDLTVGDHVTLVATSWFPDPAEAEHEAAAAMAQLELGSLANRFPHELSSGQLQLFGLSMVIARPCDVIVVDEPEQRLDSDRLSVVIGVLKGLKQTGTCIVVATHSSDLAAELSDLTINLDA